jgi:hypothetical protein
MTFECIEDQHSELLRNMGTVKHYHTKLWKLNVSATRYTQRFLFRWAP